MKKYFKMNMSKILNKYYSLIEKIGKPNFILIVFIVLIIVITGLYQTFSLYTESNGVSITDGSKTLKFILGEDRENRVTIAAGASKNLAVTISNRDQVKLKYGIYYSSSDDLTNVSIGHKPDTEYLPNGLIEKNQDYIVTIEVKNNSTSNITIDFGIIYGLETGGDLVLGSGQHWLKSSLYPAAQYIQDLYNDGSPLTTVNIDGDTSKPIVTQNATQGIMLDNNGEYRYYGATPNNYVTFNGELWRIISVSNVKSSATDTTGEMRMKIIRNEKIGDYSWDSSDSAINGGYGVNDWSKADLKKELNTLYYNQQSGNCYNGPNNASTTCDFTTIGLSNDARNMVDDALWYLGGSSGADGLSANDYYTFERGTETFECNTYDGACPRATRWVGKVGLMYSSDYVYTRNLGTEGARSWLSDTGYNEWTITMVTTEQGLGQSPVHYIDYSIGVENGVSAAHFEVRPALFLKSDVSITGGEGTDISPYQLSVGNNVNKVTITTAGEYIQDLYNDGSPLTTVNIGGDTSKPTVSQNATQGIMLDNNEEYRYYGANPNNYVTFNNELWRIINVSDVKSSTTVVINEMRMKIIRNESIGIYSWDSSDSTVNDGYGVNDWSKADLKTELNTLYYNQQSGNCYNGESNASTTCDFTTIGLSNDARNMVDDTLWYLGSSSSDGGLYVNDYYTFERETDTYNCSTDDGACPRTTKWLGKVGLMYPSDYVYATDHSLCTQTGSDWDEVCKNNNWLNYSSNDQNIPQWTISPGSTMGTTVFSLTDLNSEDMAGNPNIVRPVVVLKSDVTITSGEGTESSPYQLSVG